MPGNPRALSLADRLIRGVDQGLRTVAAANIAARPYPAAAVPESPADLPPAVTPAGLMRVNPRVRLPLRRLSRAGPHGPGCAGTQRARGRRREETDHLAWCEQRVRELDSRTSLLDPRGTPVMGDRCACGTGGGTV